MTNCGRVPAGWSVLFMAMVLSGCNSSGPLQWRELPPLPDPIGVAGPFAGAHNDVLIVVGGANFPNGRPWHGAKKIWHDGIYVFDPVAEKWRLVGTMPYAVGYGVSITTDRGVVCIGGGNATRHFANVHLLRYRDNRVHVGAMPPLPVPLAFFCGARVGETIYVAGGTESPKSTLATKHFFALDMTNLDDGWRKLSPWPGDARLLATAGAIGDRFYLIGGAKLDPGKSIANKRIYLKDCYEYNTAEKSWRKIADLPRPSVAAPSPAIPYGSEKLIVPGGDDAEYAFNPTIYDRHTGFPPHNYLYDAAANRWTIAGAFPKSLGPDPARNPNAGYWPVVTTAVVPWRNGYVIPTGEVRPGVRTPRVWYIMVQR